jgi:hypothetical protein
MISMRFLNEAPCFIPVPMKANQIVLITGGNRGLGLQRIENRPECFRRPPRP